MMDKNKYSVPSCVISAKTTMFAEGYCKPQHINTKTNQQDTLFFFWSLFLCWYVAYLVCVCVSVAVGVCLVTYNIPLNNVKYHIMIPVLLTDFMESDFLTIMLSFNISFLTYFRSPSRSRSRSRSKSYSPNNHKNKNPSQTDEDSEDEIIIQKHII